MKTKLLIIAVGIFLLKTTTISAQILNPDAFGFELTEGVNFNGGPGNVVEAFTQIAGFVQSDEQAKTGSYSMKADLVAIGTGGTIPKLQTWRATSGEGRFTTEAGKNYECKLWVYISGDAPDRARIGFRTQEGQPSIEFPFFGVEKDKWVQLTATTDLVDALALTDNWISFNLEGYNSTPSAGSVIYFDDITLTETTSTNVNESYTLNDVKLYLSNNSDILNIKSPLSSSVHIRDITGKTVLSTNTKSENTQITVSNLVSGMYIVQVSNNNKSYVQKIIIN